MRDDEARKAYFRGPQTSPTGTKCHTLVLDSPKKSKESHLYRGRGRYRSIKYAPCSIHVERHRKHLPLRLYPRKVGKGAALKAIEKALERIEGDRPAEWVAKRVKLYAESTAGQNGAFTPHPATWFNQSRYLDDPKEWEKVSLR